MGRQTAPAHVLRRRSAGQPTSHPRNVATSSYVTPAAEVDVTCRLVIAAYLLVSAPEAPPSLAGRLLAPDLNVKASGGPAKGWPAARRALERLRVLDPACGDGAFLRGMLAVLAQAQAIADRRPSSGAPRRERLAAIARDSLYGVDVQSSLAEAARASVGALAGDVPRVVAGDSLVDRPGSAWEDRFPEVMSAGGFDLIAGNPPFLRHERIADPVGRMSPKQYRDTAVHGLARRLPALPRLEGRSDLCLLFTFLSLGLLKPGGVLGLVLPDSLFDAAYGRSLSEYLEDSGQAGTILRSRTHRSFREARVNTSILLVGPRVRHSGPPIRLVVVEGPLIAADLSAVVPRPATGGECQHVPPLAPSRTDRMRFQPRASGSRPRNFEGWPSTPKTPTTDLAGLGRLQYQLKSGLNRFFFPAPETIARFGIEAVFLRPLLKSTRDVLSPIVRPEALDRRLFSCELSVEELASSGFDGALSYIAWGARQLTNERGRSTRRAWPECPSVRGRRRWYSLPLPTPSEILLPRFFDRRFFAALAAGQVMADQTFYGLLLGPSLSGHAETVAAVLNATPTYLALESAGRSGLGDGVRQYALRDYAGIRILDVRQLDDGERAVLSRAFRTLAERPILPIDEEIRQPDRQALDEITGRMTGIDRDLGAIRAELAWRVDQRLRRARSLSLASGAG